MTGIFDINLRELNLVDVDVFERNFLPKLFGAERNGLKMLVRRHFFFD